MFTSADDTGGCSANLGLGFTVIGLGLAVGLWGCGVRDLRLERLEFRV